MSSNKGCWFVLGKPLDDLEVVLCEILLWTEVRTKEDAIRIARENNEEEDRRNWNFQAMFYKYEGNPSFKKDFTEAMLNLGVLEDELEELTNTLCQQLQSALGSINSVH